MPSSHSFPPIAIITSLLLVLLITTLPSTTHSQNPGTSLPSPPVIADCQPSLLALASCSPFVQGRAPSPTHQCCFNLNQLYNQQPACLCLLLNTTTLTSYSINTSLALQLPLLCNLQFSTTTCLGVPAPPTSPISQVSFGKNNSTVAASPSVTVAPRPTILGFGFGRSGGIRSKSEARLVATLLAALAFMFMEVPCPV